MFSSIAYLIWQVAYYYGIVVARKEKIEKEGRITSFTYMLNNKRSFIGKTLAKIPPARREPSFMAGQFVYTIVTMAPSIIWLYDSLPLSVLWLITFFSVSVWNGASFYFKVMGNSKEVAALRKELEDLQREAEGRKTPGSVASMPLSEPGDMSLGTPVLAASSVASPGTTMDGHTPARSASTSDITASRTASLSDMPIPDLKLDDKDVNDSESDGSAVIVDGPRGKSD